MIARFSLCPDLVQNEMSWSGTVEPRDSMSWYSWSHSSTVQCILVWFSSFWSVLAFVSLQLYVFTVYGSV